MIIIVLIILGLTFGSFTNALVWRLHEQSQKPKPKTKKYSILHGRSMCPNCHHQLAPSDLVPIVSWLALGGKCRYCKKPIHWQYPLLEVFVAGLLTFSYSLWPYVLNGEGLFRFIIWVLVLVLLVALLVYDLRWMILPDKLNAVLFGLAILQILVSILFYHGGLIVLKDASLGAIGLGGLFYILFQVSGGRWIGGGDVKLGVGLGILAGSLPRAFLLLFLASIIGTFVSLGLIITNKVSRKARVPFGPFLIAAMVIVQLFGTMLITWYQHQFLFI